MSKKMTEVVSLKEQSEQLTNSLKQVFEQKKPQLGEFTIKTKSGDKVFQYNIAPETSVKGEVNSAVGIIREITRLKVLENELRQQALHLEDLVKEKTHELKNAERLAGIGETAGMIGHDIRNPLQTITSSTYLAEEEIKNIPDGEVKKSLQESISFIQQQTEYINKIDADLQDYAKPLCPEMGEYKLQDIIKETVKFIKIPENIQVTQEIPENLLKIQTDKSYLKRTLTNMFINSVQAICLKAEKSP